MTVYLGADHGGFELKEALKKHLDAEGHKVIDCGTDSTQSVDYAPIAEKTCLSVLSDEGSCRHSVLRNRYRYVHGGK